jgi:3-oxoadipate CoA-transferase beta subunit
VFVMMTLFDKTGAPKLVADCALPLTGLGCVSRVYTDPGTFALGPNGVRVIDTYSATFGQLQQRLAIALNRLEEP